MLSRGESCSLLFSPVEPPSSSSEPLPSELDILTCFAPSSRIASLFKSWEREKVLLPILNYTQFLLASTTRIPSALPSSLSFFLFVFFTVSLVYSSPWH